MGTATSVSTSIFTSLFRSICPKIKKYIEFVHIYRIPMENELVTKTVDLMKQTNRVKAMIDLCREEMVTMR